MTRAKQRQSKRRARAIASPRTPSEPARISDEEVRATAALTAELTRIGEQIFDRELRRALARARRRV